MPRLTPKVRALCDRVRQPATKQLFVGLLLTVPAGLTALRGTHAPAAGSSTTPVELRAVTASVPAAVEVAAYAREFRISTNLAEEIHTAALQAGVAPRVAFGLVRAESSFRPTAVSPVGAIGLTQLMPATARWLEPGISRRQLRTPETNLRVGFRYLKQLIDHYDGNEKLALTAFNRGPGTVDRLLKRGRNPDNGYAEKVLTGKSARHVALMNKKFGRRT